MRRGRCYTVHYWSFLLLKDLTFQDTFNFNVAGVKFCAAAVKRLHILHYSGDYIVSDLQSMEYFLVTQILHAHYDVWVHLRVSRHFYQGWGVGGGT